MKRFITMKWAFAAVFVGLVVLSIVAWRVQPLPAPPGLIPLVWVSDNNPLRTAQIALFNHTHPHVDLKLDPSNGDLEKVIVQSLGGVGPDVFDCGDGYQLTAYVRSGVALDVTETLRQRGINVARDTFPGIQPTGILDGRVYGVPTNIAVDGLWLHKDLFDQAGLPYPKGPLTWSQLIPIAEKLTLRNGSGQVTRYGILVAWWNWRHFLYGFGARVFTPDGTKCIVDSPQAIAAVQLMVDLVYRYHVSPSPSDAAGMAGQGGFGADDIGLFAAHRTAMAMGGRWWLAQLRNIPGLHLGVCESPYQTVRKFRAYGRVTLVNRQTKHLDEAIQFLTYLAGRPYNQLIASQADGVPAFMKYAYGSSFLHDPKHPEEDYNAVWRDITSRAIGDQVSPFVDGNLANRLFQKQFDLVQNNAKTARQAMTDAARDVNAEIQKTIEENPVLETRYRRLIPKDGVPR
jgi:ABC-type glycerol-3-phosphate transport system substrate-binding protein